MQSQIISKTVLELLNWGQESVRFAPSPTGALHIGNLRTALIAQVLAQNLGKRLWIRFEDLDPLRASSVSLLTQITDLEKFSINCTPTDLQSARLNFFEEGLRLGIEMGIFYPCFCSRKEVESSLDNIANAPHDEIPIYAGCCRHSPTGTPKPKQFIGWRFRNSANSSGHLDFLVAKSLFSMPMGRNNTLTGFQASYHLACAMDDLFSKCDLIVRAWDLESAAVQQRQLQQSLLNHFRPPVSYPLPAIFHTSLITDNEGHRLEKRSQGVTLTELLKKYQLEEIKNMLSSSFSSGATQEYAPSKIWGEAKKTLTLAQIGLK